MNDSNIPKPEAVGANPLFMFLYLAVFVGVVLYPGFKFGFNLDNYSVNNFMALKGTLIPAFVFALFGTMTVRNKKSFIYVRINCYYSLWGLMNDSL